jgi:hypothetical protein
VVLSSSLCSVQRDALDLALLDLNSEGLRVVDSLQVPTELLVRSWSVIDQASTGLVARYEVVPLGRSRAPSCFQHTQCTFARPTPSMTNLYKMTFFDHFGVVVRNMTAVRRY